MKNVVSRMFILVWILAIAVPCGLGESDSSEMEQQWLDVMKEGWLNGYTDDRMHDMMQASDALVQAADPDWLAYAYASDGYMEAACYDAFASDGDSGAEDGDPEDARIWEISERYDEEASKRIQTTTLEDILNRDSADFVKGYACCLYAMEQEAAEAVTVNEIAAELLSGDALQVLPWQNMLRVYLGGRPCKPYNFELFVYCGAVESQFYQHPEIQEACKQVIECARNALPQGSDPAFQEATCYYATCASAFLAYSAYCENDCAKFLQYMSMADEFLEVYRELKSTAPELYSSQPVAEMYHAHLHFLYAGMIGDDSEFMSACENLKQVLHTLSLEETRIPRLLPAERSAIERSLASLLSD